MMKLRHRADIRTLVWAWALMPGLVILQYGWPHVLAGWFLPVSMYASYSAAVIAHNHNHCPTFVGRGANSVFSMWISIFYGFPTYGWIPTHNENHHRYVGREGDATVLVVDEKKDNAWLALTHFFRSSKTQAPLLTRYRDRLRARSRKAWRMIYVQYIVVYGAHALMCALAIVLHGAKLGVFVYATSLFIPAFMALWGVQFTNWVQHVGCDPHSKWNHSRNFCSSWMNYFVFDNGFHTVHHDRPGMHWSQAHAEHRKVAHLIDPRLNDTSIFAYAFRTYVAKPWFVRSPGLYRWAARPPVK